jgi:hypothetical protein
MRFGGVMRTMDQRKHGTRRPLERADRSFVVVTRVPIYQQIGRRPSRVYVDEGMKPAAFGTPARRLSDNVFWHTSADPGAQIEERAGGFVLLTEPTACHAIQLSVPRPLEVDTAFQHTATVLREDREIVDKLLAEGAVIETPPARLRPVPSRLPDSLLAEDHPLVVENRPHDLDAEPPPPPDRSDHRRNGRSAGIR